MTINHKHRKTPVIILISFILTFAVGIVAALADGEAVVDPNLRQVLIDLGMDTSNDKLITSDEIQAMTGDIDLSGKNISDITGLEFAIGVDSINLHDNTIRNISALSALIAKTPLLKSVDLTDNYLIVSAENEDRIIIEVLKTAGCSVLYESQKAIPVSGMLLDKENLLICVTDTATLVPTLTPADAANQSITWQSSDTNIAEVTNGVVKGIGKGTATITATTADGGFADTCSVTVKPYSIESTKYPIDRNQGVIKNIAKFTTPAALIANISNDATDLCVYDRNGSPFTQTNVGTGMSVKLTVGGAQRDSLKVVVNGDANGDGAISIADYTLTRLDILGLKGLEDVFKTASDLNGDGKISISDYTTIRLDILGIKPITVAPDLPDVTDPRIRAFLDVALSQQGKPYVWGTEGPSEFDCSGYIYYCLRQVGYVVGRTTADSYSKKEIWPYIPRDQLQPGDLMFYKSDSNPNLIGHIGIYLGNGYHIHASSDYGCIIICKVDGWYDRMLSFGRRVFN